MILEQATFFISVPKDSSSLKLYKYCGKYPLGVVKNRMALIESSAVYIHPRGNLPVRLVKPVNDPPYFPEGIYTFYRRRGEGTWPKFLELLKYCQVYIANLQGIKRGKYSK